MDALNGLLDGPRAHRAFVVRSLLDAPWSLRIEDGAPLTVMAVVRGSAWVWSDSVASVELAAGDVAIARGPRPYLVADNPRTPMQVVIHPGQICTTPDGIEVPPIGTWGVRTWGNSPTGATELITGTYLHENEASQRLLAALPEIAILRAGAWDDQLVAYLTEQSGRDEAGQEAVLDRLLDLLLIAALRAWFARPEAETPGWYRAQSDPAVGTAIRLMESDPAGNWTVANLASAAGMSRAGLARRFTHLVGEPPMTYLTTLRLGLAADLLREPRATVTSVARRVGYSSPYAFSAAFKRNRGISPRIWATNH
ncbi:AraC family transcriptional regulator [Jatrophihabitans sp. DSM 45814]